MEEDWICYRSMTVLCKSNLPRPRQIALGDTHCKRARHCYYCKTGSFHQRPCGPLDRQTSHFQISFFWATWRRYCTGINFSPWKPWKTPSDWERCSVLNGGQHSTSCLGVSSGGWWAFSPLHVKSSSSAWIHVCINSVSFHSSDALRNNRPLRPGRFI
jgi:hypothetical protein